MYVLICDGCGHRSEPFYQQNQPESWLPIQVSTGASMLLRGDLCKPCWQDLSSGKATVKLPGRDAEVEIPNPLA